MDSQQTIPRVGACSMGAECTAQNQELSGDYRCRHCGRQLHGFSSGCSIAKNQNDFRDGVICKNQPCILPPDGVAVAKAANLPEFLWETQQAKRTRDANAPKQKRKRYSAETKAAVIERVRSDPGSRLPDIARELNIPEGTVRGWVDEYKRKSGEDSIVGAAGAPLNMEDIQASIILDPAATDTGNTQLPPADIENTPADNNDSVQPRKKKRQRYSNETKIQVILALETRKDASLSHIAKEFNVAASTVRGWRDEAANIQKAAMENRRANAKANPSKDPLKRIWVAILSLFELNSKLPPTQRLNMNVSVVRTTGKQARDALLEEHEKRPFLTQNEVINMEKFKASETWARKWSKDHQIYTADPRNGPDFLLDDAEVQGRSFQRLQKVVGEYTPDCVYSLTSMGLFYSILPNRVYVTQLTPNGERYRACKGLKSKDHLTLYLCSNESGKDKLPITCIGKNENPACFRVPAQKILPYFSQKLASNNPVSFQNWWRTVFLPHIRKEHGNGEKCLLLIDPMETCKADMFKDPTNQVKVESLPVLSPAISSSTKIKKKVDPDDRGKESSNPLPTCQPLDFDILDHVKRRYRYRLLQEVMLAFSEREVRGKIADDAQFPSAARGLKEANVANICDSMELLKNIWSEVADSTITKGWQRSRLRSKPNTKENGTGNDDDTSKEKQPKQKQERAKSEKRQTTREKKHLMRDLTLFLESLNSSSQKDGSSGALEEMVEQLKSCFLDTNGEVVEEAVLIALEDWIRIESSEELAMLNLEEVKEEMNIEYLVGLRQLTERAIPEADEEDEPELEGYLVRRNMNTHDNSEKEELDLSSAIQLATSIKSTACKLFEHGNIFGDLGVQLNGAADSILVLLRKQKEEALAKEQAEQAKVKAKESATSRKDKMSAKTGDNESEAAPEAIAAMGVDEVPEVSGMTASI